MAKVFLEDLHPISKTGIETAFPWAFGWYGLVKRCWATDDTDLDTNPPDHGNRLKSLLSSKIATGVMSKEARKLKRLKEMQQEREKLAKKIEQGQDPF